MSTHFPIVPVEVARQNGKQDDGHRLPPLVLIVDDEPLIADTLAEILRGCGLAAITAEDGAAALENARLIPPQLLLSDVALNGMNGFELAAEVTRMVPDCEVILFSGQYSTCEVASRHSDGHDFLTLVKPVHPSDMLSRVFERLSMHGWTAPQDLARRGTRPQGDLSLGSNDVRDEPESPSAA